MTIPETLKQLAALAGINEYNEETAVNDMRTQRNGHELYISKVCDDNAAYTLLLEAVNEIIPMGYKSLSLSSVKFDDMTYKLYCEHGSGYVYDLGININRK